MLPPRLADFLPPNEAVLEFQGHLQVSQDLVVGTLKVGPSLTGKSLGFKRPKIKIWAVVPVDWLLYVFLSNILGIIRFSQSSLGNCSFEMQEPTKMSIWVILTQFWAIATPRNSTFYLEYVSWWRSSEFDHFGYQAWPWSQRSTVAKRRRIPRHISSCALQRKIANGGASYQSANAITINITIITYHNHLWGMASDWFLLGLPHSAPKSPSGLQVLAKQNLTDWTSKAQFHGSALLHPIGLRWTLAPVHPCPTLSKSLMGSEIGWCHFLGVCGCCQIHTKKMLVQQGPPQQSQDA